MMTICGLEELGIRWLPLGGQYIRAMAMKIKTLGELFWVSASAVRRFGESALL